MVTKRAFKENVPLYMKPRKMQKEELEEMGNVDTVGRIGERQMSSASRSARVSTKGEANTILSML